MILIFGWTNPLTHNNHLLPGTYLMGNPPQRVKSVNDFELVSSMNRFKRFETLEWIQILTSNDKKVLKCYKLKI